MESLESVLQEFTKFHDEYYHNWNKAMQTGDTTNVEHMAEAYYVAFYAAGNEKPLFFNKEDAIRGMKDSVRHFLGASKRFDHRVIRLTDNDHAVVFYEQVIEKNGQVQSRLFTIENWQRIGHVWKLIREIEQPIK
ncbi:hypothetical protein [Radiobacillus deserti]|uniref:Nuclear transport factor 2 family protein n=1 Tax=Radiobacillus deserti TaxID=2594883 RepID=A0A516KI58_9BACI|nr:hypothetical protein [Radiobacillus deserti]QDP41088.1 hypothetical protein FN924_13335 [Radiobacillus deserti]